jgi:uracil-DNA glycosylase
MSEFLDQIVRNAVHGQGSCAECPAHADCRSQRVNPGLGNPEADLAFVTIEPSTSHTELIDWSAYENWQEYNEAFVPRAKNWPSGKAIKRILAPLDGYSFEDVWMCDSIKCSPNGSSDENRRTEFDCCSDYLGDEFTVVNPSLIVALGRLPTK